jgi:FHS family L-fucose permease-like MFS transporter
MALSQRNGCAAQEAEKRNAERMVNVSTAGATTSTGTSETQKYPGALAMVTVLFFFWGFVTVLNDILVPHLKSVFDLNYTKVMLIQFAFFAAYFIFSIPSAKLIDAIGYKKTMVVGLLTMGLGAFLFVPAASALSYPLFLGALMVLAAGITALQVAANAYVSVLGPPETASSRLNLTQAFNSLGTTIGPYVGGLLILGAGVAGTDEASKLLQASSVKVPYMIIGTALVVFAVLIGLFKLPKIPSVERNKDGSDDGSMWKYKHLILGCVGIFTYVGAEVAIGSFLINYFNQPEIGNLPEVEGAKLVAYYWGGAMAGRFIGSAILQKVKTGTVLGIAAFCACALVLTSMLTTGHVAMWSIILVGFFNSIMFPSIFTLGIAKLGPRTGDGSGLLIMAIVGGAIIPVVQGAIADRIGVHHAFVLPVICYLYIAYYALRGSHPVGVSETETASS